MTRCRQCVAFAAVLLLFTGLVAAPPLWADPVQITSGYLIAEGTVLPDIAIDMAGTQGFTLRGTPRSSDGVVTPFSQCGDCAPGVSIDLRTYLSGVAFLGTSVATLNGVEYTEIGSLGTNPVNAAIEFTGMAIAPPWANGAHATISAPFAFNGAFTTGQLPDTRTLLTGSGIATLGLPGTAGVPAGAVAETLVVPYNQVPAIDENVAAVIVEPVAANMGVIAPEPGFLDGKVVARDANGKLH